MTYKSCGSGSYCSSCSSSSSYQPMANLDNIVSGQYGGSSGSIHYSVSSSSKLDYDVGSIKKDYVIDLDSKNVAVISQFIGAVYTGGGDSNSKSNDSKNNYDNKTNSEKYKNNNNQSEQYNTIHSGILKSNRPVTQFINDAEEVEQHVRDAFISVTGEEFPKDIRIHVLTEKEMKKAHEQHGGKWNDGIMGFAVNNFPYPSNIFIRKNNLDSLMLTIGHEIGHVLTKQLSNAKDEEAKAFAFEIAWARKIVETDVGGLAKNFNVDFMPANNGLHDVAFSFVQKLVKKGKNAFSMFKEISKGILHVEDNKLINLN